MKKWTARAMGWVTHDLHGCRHIFHRRLLRSAATAPPPPPLMAMAATALPTAPHPNSMLPPPPAPPLVRVHWAMRSCGPVSHEKGFSEKKNL
jgi:hypothetical protein